jgi:hypothetical protein
VGTGAFLLGPRLPDDEPIDLDLWLLLLFVPLLPLARWRVRGAALVASEAASPEGEVEVLGRSRIPLGSILRRYAQGLAAASATVLPAALGFSTAGLPWAGPVLAAALGPWVSPGILGKAAMALELGVVLAGAAVPLLVATLLDERIPRVPLAGLHRLLPR